MEQKSKRKKNSSSNDCTHFSHFYCLWDGTPEKEQPKEERVYLASGSRGYRPPWQLRHGSGIVRPLVTLYPQIGREREMNTGAQLFLFNLRSSSKEWFCPQSGWLFLSESTQPRNPFWEFIFMDSKSY